ncbi:MAG: ATP-binding protein [Myxococcota bacterium]
MNHPQLRQSIGNWVVGDRFFDREAELQRFIELLDEGAHIQLVAPRRTGKTSLMREAERLLSERMATVFVDLEASRSPEDAIVEIGKAAHEHTRLRDRVWEFLKGVVPAEVRLDEVTLKLRNELQGADWRAKGDRLLALLAKLDRPVVLFLDEVPILVNRLVCDAAGDLQPDGRAAADAFMSWLRAAAQRHQGALRIVLSGSIGLEPILRRVGLSATLNAFTPFHLDPWSPETAAACVRALARQYEIVLDAGTEQAITDQLGCCIPHHVQMFFGHLRDDAQARANATLGPDDVRRVYRDRLLGNKGHASLSHYEERLRSVLAPSLRDLAADLLTEAAVVGRLTPTAAMALARADVKEPRAALDEILGVLEHDGYLARDASGDYAYVSHLVRDWWRARFGFNWQPVAGGSR